MIYYKNWKNILEKGYAHYDIGERPGHMTI